MKKHYGGVFILLSVIILFSACGVAPNQAPVDKTVVSVQFSLAGETQSSGERAYQDYTNWTRMDILMESQSGTPTILQYSFARGAAMLVQEAALEPGPYKITLTAYGSGNLTGILMEGSVNVTLQYGANAVTVTMRFKEGKVDFRPTIYLEEAVDNFQFALTSPTQPATTVLFPSTGGTAYLYPSVWEATITALGTSGGIISEAGPFSFEIYPDRQTTIHYTLGSTNTVDPGNEDDPTVEIRIDMPYAYPVTNLCLTETASGVRIDWDYIYTYDTFYIIRREYGSDLFEPISQIFFDSEATSTFSYLDLTAEADNAYEYGINVLKGSLESGLTRKGIQTERGLVEFNLAKPDQVSVQALHRLSEGGFVSGIYQELKRYDNAGTLVWTRSISGFVNDINELSDGDLVLAGHVSRGNYDLYIARISRDGETTVWEKTYGGTGSDAALSIDVLSDGGVIVAGWTTSSNGDVSGNHGSSDFWVLRLDASGNIVWKKCYGGSSEDYAYSVKALPDGGVIVAGYTYSNDGDVSGNHGDNDYWVIRLNANGNLIWQRCLGGYSSDHAYDILPTPDGGFIVVGGSDSSNGNISAPKGNGDTWIAKLNAEGLILWEKSYGGSNNESNNIKNKLIPLGNSRYMITSNTRSSNRDVRYNYGGYDAWVFVIDANGKLLWERTFGTTKEDWSLDICQLSDGKFFLATNNSLIKFVLNLE